MIAPLLDDESQEVGHRGVNMLLRALAGADSPRERYDALHELAAVLVRHFRHEEQPGGFLDIVIERVPRHRQLVDDLRRGHKKMLADLGWLCANVAPNNETTPEAMVALRDLVQHLQDHEAIERRILRDAVEAKSTSAERDTVPTVSSAPPLTSNRLSDADALAGNDPIDIGDLVAPERLSVVFQPIIDLLTGDVFAQECLVRCDLPEMTPPVLFERAVALGRAGRLGRLIRDIAVRATDARRLFVNIHPVELSEEWLVRPDDPIYDSGAEIFLEITESAPMTHPELCKSVLKEIGSRVGIHIVIDDLGAGYSNLMRIASLEPSIVKLDRELVAGIHTSKRQQRLVTSVVDLCVSLGAEVVAEGIETVNEYLALVDTGVHFAQGYLFARPAFPAPPVAWPPT